MSQPLQQQQQQQQASQFETTQTQIPTTTVIVNNPHPILLKANRVFQELSAVRCRGCQIHAKGAHESAHGCGRIGRWTVGVYGCLRGSMELVAVHLGHGSVVSSAASINPVGISNRRHGQQILRDQNTISLHYLHGPTCWIT
jgi:hypothetical protein